MSEQTLSLYGKIPDMLRNSLDNQCFISLAKWSIRKKEFQYCAIGTIYNQIGIIDTPSISGFRKFLPFHTREDKNEKEFYKLTNVKKEQKPNMVCPDCKNVRSFLGLLIHLNDTHHHTFPVIADKLEIARPYDTSLPLSHKIYDYIIRPLITR